MLRPSTRLASLIWQDGFVGPICARAFWFAPVCDQWAEFVEVVGREHCARMFHGLQGL